MAALLYDLGAGAGPELIHRELSERERGQSSTLRELLGYAHAVGVMVDTHGARLRGRLLEIVGDSQAARAVYRKGGSQRVDAESGELELFEAFLSVFEAAEAGGFGVVFRWVPREQLVETAMQIAGKIAEKSPYLLKLTKESLTGVGDRELEDQYRWEQGFTLQAYLSPDSVEARRAFADKRDAKF